MRKTIVLLLATAAILLSACSTAIGSTPTPSGEEKAPHLTVQAPYLVSDVRNDSADAVRSCNRPIGSGVLMSFDDSGSPEQVTAILDSLERHGAQAAFFPTGEWALEHLDLIERMRQDGHIVGNHTMTHARLGDLSANDPDEFYAETYPLENVANTSPMWLRPPYEDGAYDQLVMERLTEKNVQLCTWTVDTYDWHGDTVEEMMIRLTQGDEYSPNPLAADGVILMHMQGDHTVELIDAIMAHLAEFGLEVAPLQKK